MNAIQTAIALSFVGILSLIIAYIVNMQAQAVFQDEANAAAQTLADSVANQLRVGVASILLPNVRRFNLSISLPLYSPPFDAFYYEVMLKNEEEVKKKGVLVVYVNLTAYRGAGIAFANASKAVYNVTSIYGVSVCAEGNTPLAQCGCGPGLVNLSKPGCYTVWKMPAPTYVRQVVFAKK